MRDTATISPQPQAAPAAQVTPAAAVADAVQVRKPQIVAQRKLAIGSENDPYEHEADAMADRVMRMPEAPFVQRKCAGCEEEEQLQRKPLAADITPFIQRKGGEGAVVSDALSSQIESSKGSGSPMPEPTRSFMESRFGADFSNVRIHTGERAVQMSRELNAQAFTMGSDVYFNSDKYSPSSSEGVHLLAHELTHTIQQGTSNKKIQKQDAKPKEHTDKNGKKTYQFLGRWYEQKHFDFFSGAGYDTTKACLAEGFSMTGALFVVALVTTESGWGKGNGGQAYHNLFSIMGGEEGNVGTSHGKLRKFASYDEGFQEGFVKRIVDGVDSLGNKKFPLIRTVLTKSDFTIDEINEAFGQASYYSPGKRYSYEGDERSDWAEKYFNDIRRTTAPFMRNELSNRMESSLQLMARLPAEDQIFIDEEIKEMRSWQDAINLAEANITKQLAVKKE